MTIFSQADLERYVNKTIPAEAQKDHQIATVLKVDNEGIGAAAVFTKNTSGGWEFKGEVGFEHTWAGDNKVGAEIVITK